MKSNIFFLFIITLNIFTVSFGEEIKQKEVSFLKKKKEENYILKFN